MTDEALRSAAALGDELRRYFFRRYFFCPGHVSQPPA